MYLYLSLFILDVIDGNQEPPEMNDSKTGKFFVTLFVLRIVTERLTRIIHYKENNSDMLCVSLHHAIEYFYFA